MKRSTERILTTHTGSLARPPKLLQMLVAERRASSLLPRSLTRRSEAPAREGQAPG